MEVFDIDQVKTWLNEMDQQLHFAHRLFLGETVSIVHIDPIGVRYPRDWAGHLVLYRPGEGVVKGPKNDAYLGRCRCEECHPFIERSA